MVQLIECNEILLGPFKRLKVLLLLKNFARFFKLCLFYVDFGMLSELCAHLRFVASFNRRIASEAKRDGQT